MAHEGQGHLHPAHRACMRNWYLAQPMDDPRRMKCYVCAQPINPLSLLSYRERIQFQIKSVVLTALGTMGAVMASELISSGVSALIRSNLPENFESEYAPILDGGRTMSFRQLLHVATFTMNIWQTISRKYLYAPPFLVSFITAVELVGNGIMLRNSEFFFPASVMVGMEGLKRLGQTLVFGRIVNRIIESGKVYPMTMAIGYVSQEILRYIGGVSRTRGILIGALAAAGASTLFHKFLDPFRRQSR